MKTWHPDSWSKQARKMADKQFNFYIQANECTDPDSWLFHCDEDLTSEQTYIDFFSNSYRHPLIRGRAAARFGRLVRQYKKRKGL